MKTALVDAVILVLSAQLLLFADQIFAADQRAIPSGIINAAPVFQVTAEPEKTRVHVKEAFKVKLEVKNISHANQSFTTMLCSWQENWAGDNQQIGIWPGLECLANRPITVNLAPGECWKNKLKMWIPEDVLTSQISFKMSFTPLPFILIQPHLENGKYVWEKEIKTETYWGNQTSVSINPRWIPDWIPW